MLKVNIEKVREYMIVTGLTDRQLAIRAGVNPSTISRLFKGKMRPGGKIVAGLIKACPGLTFEQLFYCDKGFIKETHKNNKRKKVR